MNPDVIKKMRTTRKDSTKESILKFDTHLRRDDVSLTQWTFVQQLTCTPDHVHMVAVTKAQITERIDLYGKHLCPIKP